MRKTVRCEQEAPNTTSSSSTHVSLENLASGETQDRPGSVLVHDSRKVDDDMQISALDAFYEMDARAVTSKKCWIGIEMKMPENPEEMS